MITRTETTPIEARPRLSCWLGTSLRRLAAMICLAAALVGGSLWIEHVIAGSSLLAGLVGSPMQPRLTSIL